MNLDNSWQKKELLYDKRRHKMSGGGNLTLQIFTKCYLLKLPTLLEVEMFCIKRHAFKHSKMPLLEDFEQNTILHCCATFACCAWGKNQRNVNNL